MSVGKKILQTRLELKISQRRLSESTGLAVSYLSRLENGRITPTVKTLGKIADAYGVSVAAFFDPAPVLESVDRCPVSLSGACILDQLYVGRGKKPEGSREGYTSEQLKILRLCNFLLQTHDKEMMRTLTTMLKSLLALGEKKRKGIGVKSLVGQR
ncbi:MAG: helix-turn-helix domain-containing protein [Candidatus Binatia bacterium]